MIPALLQLLVGVRTSELKRLLLRTTCLVLFGPIALGVWAAEVEVASPTSEAPSDGPGVQLDLEALQRGAVALSGAPIEGAISFSGAAFADGSELRVVRSRDEAAAASALKTLVGARRGEPFTLEGRRGVKLDDGAPQFAYLELHGRDLLEVRAADAESAARRLAAQAVPPPPQLAPLSHGATEVPAAPLPSWVLPTVYAIAHLLGFLIFLYWAAQVTSYVVAASRAAISAEQLCARLLSLNEAGLPLEVSRGPREDVLTVAYHFAEPQVSSHRAILHVKPGSSSVRVRELASHRGAPRSADEARMQPISVLDPTRPTSARKVSGAQLLASTITEQELGAVKLVLEGPRVEVAAPRASELDPDRMLHLLCAIVTRSGYHWRPGLFFR